MGGIRLVNYKVKGIKSLDKTTELSFYKKVIKKPIDFRDYNIKGIYGMNGTGKTSIVTSVRILKNIILKDNYLSNDYNQKMLNELINKKSKSLEIEGDFIAAFIDEEKPLLYRYSFELEPLPDSTFVIHKETLKYRNATSNSSEFTALFEIVDGKAVDIKVKNADFKKLILEKTNNILKKTSFSAAVFENYIKPNTGDTAYLDEPILIGCLDLLLFGKELFVYLDNEDIHEDYVLNDYLFRTEIYNPEDYLGLIKQLSESKEINRLLLDSDEISVNKSNYLLFEKTVQKLCKFLRIFKSDLNRIDIEKKEYGDAYRVRLVLQYDDFSIDAEFESTGVKKLIRLYGYLDEMCRGSIVFIDEFDSNLHDVYLCALLEYLSDTAKGQLCFTSHNIGPMNILRQKKKSLDFLSVDKTIYSWKTSGNYSPATLYRNGMIEGSPFNVDMTDFIGAFSDVEED